MIPLHIILLLLFPLISFIILHTLRNSKFVGALASILSGAVFITSVVSYFNSSYQGVQFTIPWMHISDSLLLNLTLIHDRLSALMTCLVTFIACLVNIFSTEYMKDDKRKGTYFSFLSLFVFSMIGIIFSGNLFVTFIFWELVGFSSYLLIGFWYQKETAVQASKKAFLTNRIGDIGFLLGLLILWSHYKTLDILVLQDHLHSATPSTLLIVAGIGIFCGAIGKSAQFPLQIWLPDAMEGPTPVSALIHAATMVAAGVYLLVRTISLIHIDALTCIAFVGAITAFMAAFAALNQNDIKKVLAFSTISQLGYMIMAIGVGAYQYAFFHLFTHAFFKAGLFLCSGSIIHAGHEAEHAAHYDGNYDPQDMRQMGGLKSKLKWTHVAYLVAMLALSGVPFFSGFLSKDGIISGAFGWAELSHQPLFYIVPIFGLITALLTPFYMGRQWLLIFWGSYRGPAVVFNQIKENRPTITLPILLLAACSLWFLFSISPLSSEHSWVMAISPTGYLFGGSEHINFGSLNEASHHWHLIVSIISVLLSLSGLGLAWKKFGPSSSYSDQYSGFRPSTFAQRLSFSNWFLDNLYQKAFIKPFMAISKAAHQADIRVLDRTVNLFGIVNVVIAHAIALFDHWIVDGLVNFAAFVSRVVGNKLRKIQTGRIQTELLWLMVFLIGVLIIVTLFGRIK